MTEQLQILKGKVQELYHSFSSKQRITIAATYLFLVVALSLFVYYASKPEMVPLFSNSLSEQEVGEVKAALDNKGYKTYQLSADGKKYISSQKRRTQFNCGSGRCGITERQQYQFGYF